MSSIFSESSIFPINNTKVKDAQNIISLSFMLKNISIFHKLFLLPRNITLGPLCAVTETCFTLVAITLA